MAQDSKSKETVKRCKSYCRNQLMPNAKAAWRELGKVFKRSEDALSKGWEQTENLARRGGEKLEEATRRMDAKGFGKRIADESRECWDRCKKLFKK